MALDWTTGGLTAGLNAGLSQGYSSGGSAASNQATAAGQSNTDASTARDWSAKQAEIAFDRQKELLQMEMDYNSKEAKAAREWQESMANSVYTRSVANMREAGINPILAANMGLSGASVGSGQTASVGGASAPMAQGFMDSSSAWSSSSEGQSSGWNNSEQGIITALKGLGEMFGNAFNAVNSGLNLTIALDGIKAAEETIHEISGKGDTNKDGKKDITDSKKGEDQSWGNWLINQLNPLNSPLFTDLYNRKEYTKQIQNSKSPNVFAED